MKYLIVSIHDAAPPLLEYLSTFGHRVMRKFGLFRFPFTRMILHPAGVSNRGPNHLPKYFGSQER
jgi:hypothetical protein